MDQLTIQFQIHLFNYFDTQGVLKDFDTLTVGNNLH